MRMGPTIFAAAILLIGFAHETVSDTCCPNGWVAYHGSCYLFGNNKKSNMVTAENYCRQHGGHLIHPSSVRENEFIKSYISGLKNDYYWIGISDENVEGVWQIYGTDDDLTFTDWVPGQPHSDAGDEDCAAYYSGKGAYRWYDALCTDQLEPLCEREGSGTSEIVG